ncbi:MAG: membrane protein insertase YidC [Candidatus Aminicenantes bacterium]|nr:membrane protein insertase YidC [Candidatus Aminicenantes bacterium]
MEKRVILAIVLSFLVMVLYQMIFMKPKPQAESPVQVGTPAQAVESSPALPPAAAEAQPEVRQEEVPAVEAPLPEEARAESERQVVVESSLYRAVWSNRGASLRSWKLKEHLDEGGEGLELVSRRAGEVGRYPFFLDTQEAELDRTANNGLFIPSMSQISLDDGETGELKFYYSDGKNVRIEKIFVFIGGTYHFDVLINVWKDGRKVEPRIIWGPGIGNPVLTSKRQQFGAGSGVAILAADKVYRINERKYKPESNAFNFASWAAYEDNYMTALFITAPQQGTALFLKEVRDEAAADYYLSVSAPRKAFMGPKEFDRLRAFGHESKKLINFGFFGAIAEILLISIKAIHKAVPNWGFAIIILTFLIKIVFFPLTYSSTKSMAKMQELQPKIKALRARYKKAKQDINQRRQMNEEMMKLYKEHGINPAGGCLPILIQIPVFWGFFRMLVVAVEFRHSPFILWIKDLSVHDPYYVTPILMGATQFISQKMTPTSADPSQAKMMLIMPVVMTIFFMNFQSGLVLYWLTNNVLQIGQQCIMNRMMAKKKRESHGKRKK